MDGENPDLLELLAPEQSESEPELQSAQGGKQLTPKSVSTATVKSRSKRGRDATAVTREEFSSLQGQLKNMADAMDNIQTVMLTSFPERPDKRQKLDHCSSSEESVAIDNAVTELLRQGEDANGDVLQSFEQLYADEDPGNAVGEKLASIIGKMLRHKAADEKIAAKLKDYKRPANIPQMECTRVNPEIWASLKSKTRSLDIKFQKVQQAIMKATVPIVACIESQMKANNADAQACITRLLDAVAIIGHANYELNLRRRELIRPDLNQQFGSLCSTQVPVTDLLFGGNLPEQCKNIQETNKLGNKVSHRFGTGRGLGRREDKFGERSDRRSQYAGRSLNYYRPNWRKPRFQKQKPASSPVKRTR